MMILNAIKLFLMNLNELSHNCRDNFCHHHHTTRRNSHISKVNYIIMKKIKFFFNIAKYSVKIILEIKSTKF
jgi:hypothetical protein